MPLNSAEAKLHKKILPVAEELALATPGFLLQAYQGGKLQIDYSWGKTWRYYDLASLTKIIFTATVCARMVEKRLIQPADLVHQHWTDFTYKNIRLDQLWTHTAGLPWWRPFYKKLKGPRQPELRWVQMSHELLKLKKEKVKKAVYSDPDLLITSQVLQLVKQQNLEEMWSQVARPEWVGQLHFNIGDKRLKKKSDYAPTEKCPWRCQTMQGLVHDENAYALGGIAPHSGLFGRPQDVAKWAMMWRKALRGEAPQFLSEKTACQFVQRQIPAMKGDWGWLFMKPTKGRASCGRHFSAHSFGHTGFTGTSIWFDPRTDRQIILLSNRVHPTRENTTFLHWRPWLHDAVCESL